MTEGTDRELLIRIDERVRGIETQMNGRLATKDDVKSLETRVALLEKINFGTIGLVLVSVVGAIGGLIFKG